jgi:L-2-hydroxyglutarate oxidase
MMDVTYDYCVVGGGIVGAATAMALLERAPGARLLLVERESDVAAHQTGHNSGVIHSGIYYQPGSLKARLCREGERATKAFCDAHGIPYRVPGKLIVATEESELPRLRALQANAATNGIEVRWLDTTDITDREPAITGVAALWVSISGIVDYREVTRAMIGEITRQRAEIVYGTPVAAVEDDGDGVTIFGASRRWRAQRAVVCAGIDADRLARCSGLDPDFVMIPFRGDYYQLRPELSEVVTSMIYPVPDPTLPFLGIHLTPMIDGSVTVGPNAVLSAARYGYGRFSINLRDVATTIGFTGFWRLMAQHWRSVLSEAGSALSRREYLARCRRYAPSLTLADLRPYRSGIRAQAVTPSGTMIHDFHFLETERVLHVANAPSPAATSAIPIGRWIAAKLLERGP